MNTKLRFFLVLTVVSMLIVSCGGGGATEAPSTEKIQACSVTPDGDGQSYSGKVSALTILDKPHGIYVYNDVINQIETSGEFNSPITAGADFQGNTGLSSSSATASSITDLVVILVVDTFSNSDINQNTNANDVVSFTKRVDLYLDSQNNAKGLLVVAVDTNGLNFGDISKNIPAAIGFFSMDNVQLGNIPLPKARGFVLNMSFVFVPCDSSVFDVIKPVLNKLSSDITLGLGDLKSVESMEMLGANYEVGNNFYNYVNCLDEYKDNCRQALGDLRARLEKLYPKNNTLINDAVFNAFIVDLVYDPDANQSWLKSFDDFQSQLKSFDNVVYVGAAGNFEYDHPLTPASWDFVVSISSDGSTSDSNCRKDVADYSNCGEVKLDGVYYGDPNIVGTSFAAPRFSAKVAQNFLLTQPSLINSSCPMRFNISTSPTGPWNNAVYSCAP